MADQNVKKQAFVQKTVKNMKIAAFLSLLTNIYEVYGFFSGGADPRQILGIVLGLTGTILIWQFARQLQAGRKQAMYYWLTILAVGMIRWISVGAAFSINVFSILLVSILVVFTLQMVTWARNEVPDGVS